jgi:fatty acid desaturase
MEEQFETRQLLTADDLRGLLSRRNGPSAARLALHLGAFVALIAAVTRTADIPWLALPLSVALAWVWSALFAPFHESTHRTAFTTPGLNRLAAWLTGIPFGMAPSVYRTFHYEHHRHMQELARDPELSGDPRYAAWPPTPATWLLAMSGYGLIWLKLRPLLGFALQPREDWPGFARWADRSEDKARLVFECCVLLALWAPFVVSALSWLPGGGWLLFAAWFTHVFQVLWVSAEHTGLPLDGGILARTRTVVSNPFVRFWLWNMKNHAEHHGWPAIPWHRPPAAHALVQPRLESCMSGYVALHRSVLGGGTLPRRDPCSPVSIVALAPNWPAEEDVEPPHSDSGVTASVGGSRCPTRHRPRRPPRTPWCVGGAGAAETDNRAQRSRRRRFLRPGSDRIRPGGSSRRSVPLHLQSSRCPNRRLTRQAVAHRGTAHDR